MRHMEIAGMPALPKFPLILDGTYKRFKTNATGDDGWYIGSNIQDYTIVSYGDWSKDIKGTYHSHKEKEWPMDVKIEFDEILLKRKEEESRRIEEVYQNMRRVWDSIPPGSPNTLSPYLIKKKLQFHPPLKQIDETLGIPLYDSAYNLKSIQYIYSKGNKRFYKGLPTKDLFFFIGSDREGILYLTESVGNALTIIEATNTLTYASLSAQALPSIASIVRKQHPKTKIIIVADNDGENGIGQQCAYDAKRIVENVEVIIPSLEGKQKCDISDVWIENGKNEVSKQLVLGECTNDKECNRNASLETSLKSLITDNKGIISQIMSYYNKTSYQHQPGFALITSLAFCSTILGRRFKTNLGHYPSLYFLNIGKSGAGKEHQIRVIRNLLNEVKYTSRLGPSGYTSPGAIMTALMNAPAHITLIDEFGDYLISLQDKKSPQRLVNRCLLQLFGCPDGSYVGEQYSKFSGNKDNAEPVVIQNPALTILGGVQPEKLYENINESLIKDGFLGRFLIYETNLLPKPVKYMESHREEATKERNAIAHWCKDIDTRLKTERYQSKFDGYAVEPPFETINFSKESIYTLDDFSEWITNEYMPKLEKIGASQISARWLYMTGSLSLIIALSNDPFTTSISNSNVIEAIKIVKTCGINFVYSLSKHMSSSTYEKNKNLFLDAIRTYGEKGIVGRDICRKKPFYRFTKRERDDIISDLISAELICCREINVGKTTKLIYSAS